MSELVLKVHKRDGVGKNKVDKLRQKKLIPGVCYGKGQENINIEVSDRDFDMIFQEAGTSTIIDLDIDGEKSPALIKDVQFHPYKNEVLHVDIQKVRADEKIRLMIPIVLENRDNIRVEPSVLIQEMEELAIECLPGNLPQAAVTDVEDMQIDEVRYIRDLDIASDENINILADPDDVVCSLTEPSAEEITEEVEEVDAADVETLNGSDEEEEE